jgi:hypothetical protein
MSDALRPTATTVTSSPPPKSNSLVREQDHETALSRAAVRAFTQSIGQIDQKLISKRIFEIFS